MGVVVDVDLGTDADFDTDGGNRLLVAEGSVVEGWPEGSFAVAD